MTFSIKNQMARLQIQSLQIKIKLEISQFSFGKFSSKVKLAPALQLKLLSSHSRTQMHPVETNFNSCLNGFWL